MKDKLYRLSEHFKQSNNNQPFNVSFKKKNFVPISAKVNEDNEIIKKLTNF